MIKTIIVEDEHHSQQVLKKLLNRFHSDIEVLAIVDDVETARIAVEKIKPDLIFLDIELKMKSAFDLLNQIDTSGMKIVFTTAFEQYAIRAIRYSAVDYLLKPIDIDELSEAMTSVRNKIKSNFNSSSQIETLLGNIKHKNSRLAIPTVEGFDFIAIEDVFYCQADGGYSIFVTSNKGKIVSSKPLKYYESLLNGSDLFRVSKSFIINVNYVSKFIKGKSPYIIMLNGLEVSVSPTSKLALLDLMQNK